MTRGRWLLLACVLGCGKASSQDAPPVASASAAPATGSAAAAAPSASAAGSAGSGVPAPAGGSRTLRGHYKTSVAALTPAPSPARARAGTDSTEGVGEGALVLTIDGTTGHVTGTLDGAIGAAVVEGVSDGSKLSAAVRRRDPTDRGLSGTLTATLAGDHAAGALTLASADGAVLRSGVFDVSAAPAP